MLVYSRRLAVALLKLLLLFNRDMAGKEHAIALSHQPAYQPLINRIKPYRTHRLS